MILNYIVYSALALLVAYLWLCYLRMVDVFQPETWKRILITFSLGCLSVLPIIGLHELFPSFFEFPTTTLGWLFYYIFKVGLLEEICKLIFAIISLRFFIKQKEPVDYVVHAAVAALGFATVENVLYLSEYGVEIIRGRAGFSALSHMTDTAIPMYFYIRCKLKQDKNQEPILHLILGLFLASIMHGFYDFFLVLGTIFFLLTLLVYLISIELWLTFINNLLNLSPHFKKNITTKYQEIQRLLLWGFLLLSFIEFTYGWGSNNWQLEYISHLIRIPFVAIMLVLLITVKLSKIRLIPGKQFPILYQITFALNPRSFIPNSNPGTFSSATHNARMDSVNEMEITKQVYRKINLVSRDGSAGNVIGIISDKVWGKEDEVFFKFEPETRTNFRDFRSDVWLLKAQTAGNTFYKDLYSEVFALLMPLGAEITDESLMQDFPAYGRYYIIPIEDSQMTVI